MRSYSTFVFVFLRTFVVIVVCQDENWESIEQSTDLSLEYLHKKLSQNSDPPNSSKVLPYCNALVKEYGKQSSSFIKCSVENARPFRFCEGCVVDYERTLTVYKDILENDETMDNCKYILLNSDRVQVINSVHQDIVGIWETADCDKCFDPFTEDVNATVHYTLNKNTKDFLVLYNNFTKCIPPSVNGTFRNDTVCDTCRSYYRSMNALFDKLLNDDISPHHVCMDIVDMMNYTRLQWGDELQCTVTEKQRIPVIILTVLLLLIPVVFYTSITVYGTKKERTLMIQKRLSSLSTSYSYGTYENSHLLGTDHSSTAGSPPGSLSPSSQYRGTSLSSNTQHTGNNIIPDPR